MVKCPKCKTSDYNNRSFRLMVNVCGHSLCSNCVDNLFSKGSGPCPDCGKTLKMVDFWQQTFDNPLVEKEVFWRRKLKKVYNLKEDDFPDLTAFNDYLESVETMVLNLTADIDVEETLAQVEAYERSHRTQIDMNKRRKNKDDLWIEQHLERERHLGSHLSLKTSDLFSIDSDITINQNELMDELRKSDQPAQFILDRKRKQLLDAKLEDLGSAGGRKKPRLVSSIDSGERFLYIPLSFDLQGPQLEIGQVRDNGFREETIETLAGGFTNELAYLRILTDTASGLFLE